MCDKKVHKCFKEGSALTEKDLWDYQLSIMNYPIEDGLERRKREVGMSVGMPLSCPNKKKNGGLD